MLVADVRASNISSVSMQHWINVI